MCLCPPTGSERIVDSYPAEGQGQIRAQLADSLRAIVVQRQLLFQNSRRLRFQKFRHTFEIIASNLHPIRRVRRTQKQKIPEHLVVVSPRLKPYVLEKRLEHVSVVHVFEHRHVHPRLMSS